MPFDTPATQAIAPIAAYVCTDEGAAVARLVIERRGGGNRELKGGGLSGAARLCSGAAVAQIVLAEIGNIPVQMACECVAEIKATGAGVIVLGAQTDIDTYRAIRRAGALDYFAFPVSAEDILAVGQGSVVADEPPAVVARGLAVAVIGCRGGVGASLLAQNLAFHGAAIKGGNRRTALLDADLHYGSQAIDLDRDETKGLFEALRAPDRCDDTFISATMDPLNDHLSLYSHQIRMGQEVQLFESGLPRLFAPLRQKFGAVICDMPRSVLVQQADVVQQLDAVVLVIPPGFAGVHSASRLVEWLRARNGDLRILPVLSELRADAALSRKDLEAAIGQPLRAVLPRVDAALARAIRAARPLIEAQPAGAYAKAVRAIWAACLDAPDKAKPARRSLVKRMFG